MNNENIKVCGDCKSAARSTTSGMQFFIWCLTGQAAAQSGNTCIRACYVNPHKKACDDFELRTTPLEDAPTPQKDKEDQPSDDSHLTSSVNVDSTPPWDLPEPIRAEAAPRQDQSNKDALFSTEFFL